MRIVLVTNDVRGGWSPWEPQGWAGGEEIIVKFADALALHGHTVHVVYDTSDATGPRLSALGVEFIPRSGFVPAAYDVALYFKCPEKFDARLAPRSYVWTDQERAFLPDPFVRVVACSQYLGRWIDSMVPRASSRLAVIPYGIDCAEVLAARDGVTRDPREVLHCASPDRGLDVFLELWPRVLAEVPDATLTIAYGWELFDKYGGSPALKAKILAQVEALRAAGASITMARLERVAMHQALHRAGVWAYYCTGGEQFGLTALKAQLAGCRPVVKPWGALHETVSRPFQVSSPEAFTQALVDALHGVPMVSAQDDATTMALAHDWPAIVAQWETLWASDAVPAGLTAEVMQTPGPPPFAEPVGWNLPQLVHGTVAEWMQALQPKAPYIDPTLHFPAGAVSTPEQADAVLLGFGLEDTDGLPGQWVKSLGIRSGTPVLLFVSHGTWRAATRHRVLSPADVRSILGMTPDFHLRSLAFNAEGDGVTCVAFRYLPERILADRDRERARRIRSPRQTLSVCYMVRNVAEAFAMSLGSVAPLADEVCIVDTGSTDATPDVIADWQRKTGIPVTYTHGTSPRWCYDCLREHAVGEMAYGHRVAGFETPRNESIALAKGDHILWLDADEELLNPGAAHKYLRPNPYEGYGIPQHHHSVNPPEAAKVDYPVRMFRRTPDRLMPAGTFAFGPHAWPTYHSGLTARFTGLVHEHPGFAPSYTEGLGPVIILSDVWISHRGYFLEDHRRKRFVRNWPLMVADRQKYPTRRLGRFLWIRDVSHQMRYLLECNGGQMTPDAVQLALEGANMFRDEFAGAADAYCQDALMFATTCMQALGRGVEYRVKVEARKPELAGEQTVATEFTGRFDELAQMLKAIQARMEPINQWEGPYA